ncbi:MAG: hypothetical protein LBJ31_01095 [Treponema sp.]|jgi:hypothetical protein|nr:hypothetical protein [Treponema sp.]
MSRKKAVWAMLFVCAVFLLFGCETISRLSTAEDITVDDTAAEKSALVIFGPEVYVLEYNGVDVEKEWYPRKKTRLNRITLPAGDTTLRFNLDFEISSGGIIYRYRQKNVEMQYTFEAGKEYTVAPYGKTIERRFLTENHFEYGLGIWDRASTDGTGWSVETAIKSWKLGDHQ